jgi:hypothetical protein
VTVTVLAALVFPTAVLPNEMLVGDTLTGSIPEPLKATVCGLFGAVSLTVSVAVSVPRFEGLNAIPRVHFCPAPTDAPHPLLAIMKSAFVVVIEFTVTAEVPLFVSVMFLEALVVPIT